MSADGGHRPPLQVWRTNAVRPYGPPDPESLTPNPEPPAPAKDVSSPRHSCRNAYGFVIVFGIQGAAYFCSNPLLSFFAQAVEGQSAPQSF